MRLTDDRYASERRQFELAMRMIGHEARTRTIRRCTGLSDDRIRKLYTTYFKHAPERHVRRRRGKSPQRISRFVKNPEHQLHATTLVALFAAGRLLRFDPDNRVVCRWPRPDVEFGHRVCRAYENYLLLCDRPLLSFEWAWNLIFCISRNDELCLATCRSCRARYVHDAYALDVKRCPTCSIAAAEARRSVAHGLSAT